MNRKGGIVKNLFAAVALLALLGLGSRDLHAQVYDPYYYDPYWAAHYQNYLQWQQYLAYLQQYDPYWDLHVIHYELYLQPYQPYQIYAPCCFTSVVVVPERSKSNRSHSRRVTGPPPQVVGPRPRAVTPLPRAVDPLPSITGRR
jgi:hypothetical protein